MNGEVLSALVALARATEGNEWNITADTRGLITEAINDDGGNTESLLKRIEGERKRLVPDCFHCASPCGRTAPYDLEGLINADEETKKAKHILLSSLKEVSGKGDDLIFRVLYAIGRDDWSVEELLQVLK